MDTTKQVLSKDAVSPLLSRGRICPSNDKSWILQEAAPKKSAPGCRLYSRERLTSGTGFWEKKSGSSLSSSSASSLATTHTHTSEPWQTDSDVTRPQEQAILQELRAFQEEVRSELRAQEERIVRMESSVGAGMSPQAVDDAVTKQVERQLSTFVEGLGALSAHLQQVLEANHKPRLVMPTLQEDTEQELLALVGEALESDELATQMLVTAQPLSPRLFEAMRDGGAIPTLAEQLREQISISKVAANVKAAAVQPQQREWQYSPLRSFPNRATGLMQPLKASKSNTCAPGGANDLRSRLEELDKFHQDLTTGGSSLSTVNALASVTGKVSVCMERRCGSC